MKKALKAALPYTIPVFFGYICLGIAFGILLSSKGYHFGWAFLMSLTVYAGSMQFVAISLLAPPISLLHTFLMTLSVNARHVTYGISMLEKFRNLGRKKPYLIFSLTDETYSILCGVEPPEDVDKGKFYFCISFLDHLYWITGSVIGAVAGTILHFNTKGIDFSMTALFLVTMVGQWESEKNHTSAIMGVIVSLLSLVLFGSDNFIIPAIIGIISCLLLGRKQIEKTLGRAEIKKEAA